MREVHMGRAACGMSDGGVEFSEFILAKNTRLVWNIDGRC